MPAGVPSGYNSKGDFFKGITTQMRANEKSSSPGFPGNRVSVAEKLSELKASEASFLKFKPLSNMKVDASDVSAFVQKLDVEKTNKVGFSGKSSSDITDANAIKAAEKDRIKALDDAHYSLSGKAAREQQGLSWYQPLDISTVGGNTRGNKGQGLDAQGDYLDQEFMSFTTPENFTGKIITTNLRSAKDIELFGDSESQLAEINMDPGSQSLMHYKDEQRIVNAIINDKDPAEADNFKIQQIKENANFQTQLELVQDERSKLEIVSDSIDGFTKPLADYITDKVVDLNNTTMLGEVTSHLVDSYNAADQSLDRVLDNISDIGKGFVDFGLGYVDAVKSVGTLIDTEQDFIKPSEFADMREQAAAEVAKEQKRLQTELNNRTDGYVEYYNNRIKGDAAAQAKKLEDAEKYAAEIMAHKKAHTNRQQVVEQFEVEREIEAFEKQLEIDLATERSNKIAESKRQRINDVKERTAALQREREDKRQNDLIDDISNKSDAAAAELAAEKAKKQRESHDKFQNDRIDDIANASDSAASERKKQMDAAAAANAAQKYQDQINNPTADDIAGPPTQKFPFQTLGRGDGSLHGTDPFRFTTLEYPKNITSDAQYGHYILFYVNVQNKTKYRYAGYNDDGNIAVIGDVVEKQTYKFSTFDSDDNISTVAPTDRDYTTTYTYSPGANAEPVAFQQQAYGRVYEGGRANLLQSNQVTLMRQRKATQGIASRMNAAGKPLTSRITDSVAMYLPSEVGNTTSTKYQGAELGMLGYLALGGADLLGQLQNRDFAGMGDTAVGMIDSAITEGIKKTFVAAADTFTGTQTQGSIDKVFGQTVNPFIEVAFENIGIRSFEYTFNFRPKSKEETDEVRAIIHLFRFHMVPELKGSNHRYMTLPSTFDIHYMYQSGPEVSKENEYYNKIATCVLESCDVNYAPSGVKSFDDGAPTQITMALRFMETEMLTKEKVNKGF